MMLFLIKCEVLTHEFLCKIVKYNKKKQPEEYLFLPALVGSLIKLSLIKKNI